MLTDSIKNKWIKSFEMLIDSIGSPIEINLSAWGGPLQINAGVKTVSPSDTELVNAYGVGARIITVKKKDVPFLPKKFDTVVIKEANEKLVISSVNTMQINSVIVGYKLVTAGK